MTDDRRSEMRLPVARRVFIEVAAGSADGREPPRILVCQSVDFSANGLQVQVDDPLPVGAILRLCAEPGAGRAPHYLVGEVRWVRPATQGHCVGFGLFASEQTDIEAWKETIAGKLAD